MGGFLMMLDGVLVFLGGDNGEGQDCRLPGHLRSGRPVSRGIGARATSGFMSWLGPCRCGCREIGGDQPATEEALQSAPAHGPHAKGRRECPQRRLLTPRRVDSQRPVSKASPALPDCAPSRQEGVPPGHPSKLFPNALRTIPIGLRSVRQAGRDCKNRGSGLLRIIVR